MTSVPQLRQRASRRAAVSCADQHVQVVLRTALVAAVQALREIQTLQQHDPQPGRAETALDLVERVEKRGGRGLLGPGALDYAQQS